MFWVFYSHQALDLVSGNRITKGTTGVGYNSAATLDFHLYDHTEQVVFNNEQDRNDEYLRLKVALSVKQR